MTDRQDTPNPTHLTLRGEWDEPGSPPETESWLAGCVSTAALIVAGAAFVFIWLLGGWQQ